MPKNVSLELHPWKW